MTVTLQLVTCASSLNPPIVSFRDDVSRSDIALLGEDDAGVLSVTTSLYFDVVPTFLPIYPLGLRQSW